MKSNLFLVFALLSLLLPAQIITHGPVLGAVTPTSARIYYSTNIPANLTIQVSKDSLFSEITPFVNTTTTASYRTAITPITGLNPSTRYYYRVLVNDVLQPGRGTFRSFPPEGEPGYYRIVVGSCNYNPGPGGGSGNPFYQNDLMFQDIVDFDPDMVIHLGDWGFPPAALGSNYNLFPDRRAESFRLRYQDYNFKKFIQPNLPVDFVYDDDYSHNGTAGWTWPSIRQETLPNGNIKYALYDNLHPEGVREGAIEAYFDHFPGYGQVDTSGVHHSFRIGNVEFFILDTRSSKSPVHQSFKYNPLLNIYSFNPPAGHTTLGPAQMQWLLDGLSNSTADWKVIGSSVVFNRALGNLIETVLLGQLFDRSLIEFATALGYMWGGYPKDQNTLLKHIKDNNINNVIMLSGDTHSSMLDDGKNAGLPEVSSSGWSAGDEGYLNSSIDSIVQMLGLPISVGDVLWNGGGNGIGNFGTNYNDTYARMEFFGRDSMRACVIDEFLQTLGCMTILSKGIPTGTSTFNIQDMYILAYPNPAKDALKITLQKELPAGSFYTVSDIQGKQLIRSDIGQGHLQMTIPLNGLSHGMYVLSLHTEGQVHSKKFLKK
jgi:alkaline phosphatase D